jgi:TP901 family phage tail tape measure protein
MPANTSVINVAILSDTEKFRKGMQKATTSVSDFSRKAGLAFAGVVGAGAALGLSVARDMETMRNNIIQGTGASGDALDALVENARQVAMDVPQSFDEVSGALADVNTAFGLTGSELEAQTELFLNFSRAAGVDASSAISQVDAALTQFGQDAGDADEALGDLLRIAQATGRPMETLLGNVRTFGPVFANMGFSLEETTALMGQLAQGGVDVTRIAPGLNAFSRNIAELGGDPRQALEDTVAAIQAAATDTEALNLATEAFGAEGAQRLSSAIRTGNLDLENFSGLLGEGAGAVDEQADAMLTLQDRINILKNRAFGRLMPIVEKVTELAEDLATAFSEDGLAGAADLLRQKLRPVTDWMERNKPIMAAVAVVIGTVLAGAVYSLVAAIAALLSPVVLVVAAIAALAAGVVWAYENVGWFRDAVNTAYEGLKIYWAFISDHVLPILQTLGEIAFEIGQTVAGVAVTIFEKWQDYAGRTADILGAFFDPLQTAAELIFGAIATAWNSTVGGFGFSVPGWIPEIGGKEFRIPNIPELADGGIVSRPTLALIGEAGPEAVIPLDRAGSMGTTNIQIVMPAGADGDDVVRALQDYQRRRGSIPITASGARF